MAARRAEPEAASRAQLQASWPAQPQAVCQPARPQPARLSRHSQVLRARCQVVSDRPARPAAWLGPRLKMPPAAWSQPATGLPRQLTADCQVENTPQGAPMQSPERASIWSCSPSHFFPISEYRGWIVTLRTRATESMTRPGASCRENHLQAFACVIERLGVLRERIRGGNQRLDVDRASLEQIDRAAEWSASRSDDGDLVDDER